MSNNFCQPAHTANKFQTAAHDLRTWAQNPDTQHMLVAMIAATGIMMPYRAAALGDHFEAFMLFAHWLGVYILVYLTNFQNAALVALFELPALLEPWIGHHNGFHSYFYFNFGHGHFTSAFIALCAYRTAVCVWYLLFARNAANALKYRTGTLCNCRGEYHQLSCQIANTIDGIIWKMATLALYMFARFALP